MPLFENASCPVCNGLFEDGDDIVVCPECGTPHHRKCYNAIGHCVNRGLHASGYSYSDEKKKAEIPAPMPALPKPQDNASFAPETSKDNNEIEKQGFPSPFVLPVFQNNSYYEQDKQKIDGESVADYAVTIRTNIPRFINAFKQFEYGGKKLGWNWGAFLFGSLYLFYRKMYKQAVAYFCAFIAVVFASSYALANLAPKYIEAVRNFSALYAQNKLTEDIINEYATTLPNISDTRTAGIILYAAIAVIIVLRIIQGLYADKYYKATISAFIKNVNEQLDNGASFVQTSFSSSDTSDMSQEQMKKYYLARRGGTTFFLPMMVAGIAYFLISLAYSTFLL